MAAERFCRGRRPVQRAAAAVAVLVVGAAVAATPVRCADNEGAASTSTSTAGTHAAPPPLQPYAPAPALTLPTLSGSFKYSPSAPAASNPVPVIAFAFDSGDAFSAAMWSSNESVDTFLQDGSTPPIAMTHYLFLSYASTTQAATAQVSTLRDRLETRMHALGFSSSEMAAWAQHLHFATTPVAQVGGWLTPMLANWTSPLTQVRLTVGTTASTSADSVSPKEPDTVTQREWFPRVDSMYAWLPWPAGTGYANSSIVDAGDGCAPISVNATGKLALLQATAPLKCSYNSMIMTAQKAGATGVLVAAPSASAPFVAMNCDGDECNSPPSITASMISFGAGQAIRTALAAPAAGAVVNITFVDNSTSGFVFGIDDADQLVEVGWLKYPWLRHLTWQAQWLAYKSELRARLATEAAVVPVFGPSAMAKKPVVASVTLPPVATMRSYGKLELDMALSCPGTQDRDCPIWDHTIQLKVCCGGGSTDPFCNQEMGRWISPFRRRIGRWLTDVTPLLPLLTTQTAGVNPQGDSDVGPTCEFSMSTVPWAMPWVPSLNLRFSNPGSGSNSSGGAEPPAAVPTQLIMLFRGGTFDKNYNTNRTAVTFTTPANLKRAELVSVITGHGSDNNGCGEFCPTSHHFVVTGVNGTTHDNSRTFSEAGTPLGCAAHVLDGAEPNEHGTWVFGRDGWCDGQNVAPGVVDITDQLWPPGSPSDNSISYHGDYQGHTPDPTASPGYIIMYSWVALYT